MSDEVKRSVLGLLAFGPVALAFASAFSCAPRDRMCAVDAPCGADRACVGGRCVSPKKAARLFEVDDAGAPLVKRIVHAPVDMAWLSSRGGSKGALPAIAALGERDDAVLLLRFGASLPERSEDLVEAYVVLTRADMVDPPDAPVSLYASRILDLWDSRSVTWARAPRLFDLRTPETRALPSAAGLVRIDVRALVLRWSRRDPEDQGIAIVADGSLSRGVAIVLVPGSSSEPTAFQRSPFLELYVR